MVDGDKELFGGRGRGIRDVDVERGGCGIKRVNIIKYNVKYMYRYMYKGVISF